MVRVWFSALSSSSMLCTCSTFENNVIICMRIYSQVLVCVAERKTSLVLGVGALWRAMAVLLGFLHLWQLASVLHSINNFISLYIIRGNTHIERVRPYKSINLVSYQRANLRVRSSLPHVILDTAYSLLRAESNNRCTATPQASIPAHASDDAKFAALYLCTG